MMRTFDIQAGLLAAGVLCSALTAGTASAATPAKIDFNRDIRPILSENCYTCHGPDAAKLKSNLRFDLKEWCRARRRRAR